MQTPVDDKDLRKAHRLIYSNAKKLFNLIDQLLEFRKADSGLKKLIVHHEDIIAFLRELFIAFKPMAAKKNMSYSFESDIKELYFYFDRDSIEKIVVNLLSNAFKYTPPDGKIVLKVSNSTEEVLISVIDNGIGIDPKYQRLIFDRFFQAESEDARLGTGIGLAFVKKLVELHHGTIEVQSESGRGAAFIVALPLNDSWYAQDEHKKLQAPQPLSLEAPVVQGDEISEVEPLQPVAIEKDQETLLIIDDNQEMVSYLSDFFSRRYNILTASNGKEAIPLLDKNEIGLIICDVMMPEMDGISFCKYVKQNVAISHIPIILLTAKDQFEDRIKGLKIGADDYISKPFSIYLLDVKVQNILRTRKLLREYYSKSDSWTAETITFNPVDEEFLKKAVQIVEESMIEPDFSVDKLSKELLMSRSNLYLKIKAITGESASDFVKRIRFKRAAELLESRKHTVAEVAYMCGFSSPSYFSTAFKSYYNVLPTEYVVKSKPVAQ